MAEHQIDANNDRLVRSDACDSVGQPLIARRLRFASGLLFLALTALVLWTAGPGRKADIFLDDHAFPDGMYGLVPWPLSESIDALKTTPLAGRPLVAATFSWNAYFTGFDPATFRFTNALVHALNGFLAAVYAQQILRLAAAQREDSSAVFSFSIGWAVAAIWMFHPLHAECVTYISQRTELLMATSMIAGLSTALGAHSAKHPLPWELSCTLCGLAGVWSKETAILLPALILLADRCLTFGSWSDLWRARRRLYLMLSSVIAVGLFSMLTRPRGDTVGWKGPLDSLDYGIAQIALVGGYLQRLVLPTNLVLDYGDANCFQTSDVVTGAAWICGTGVILWLMARRAPAIGYCACVALLLLLPSSSFIPIQSEIGAERRFYLPSMILLLSCGIWIQHAMLRPSGRWRFAIPVSSAIIVALLLIAELQFVRSRHALFCNPVEIWTQDAAIHPGNWRAWHNLGTALEQQNNPSAALDAYRKAIDAGPFRSLPYRSIARLGNPQLALNLLQVAQENPNQRIFAATTIASILQSYGDGPGALDTLFRAHPNMDRPLNPSWFEGEFYQTAAASAIAFGDYGLARRLTARAISADVNAPRQDALLNLGMIQSRTGQHREAKEQLTTLLIGHVSSIPLVVKALSGTPADAELGVTVFRAALVRRPSQPKLHLGLAKLLVSLKRTQEAIDVLSDGLKVDPRNRDLRSLQIELIARDT